MDKEAYESSMVILCRTSPLHQLCPREYELDTTWPLLGDVKRQPQ